jgi:hypothetical protein
VIPDKYIKMVRYAGIFATRWRAHYFAHARRLLEQHCAPPQPETSPVSLLGWRARRQAEGTDPLLCPSYRFHTGHPITVDPHSPPDNAYVHASY